MVTHLRRQAVWYVVYLFYACLSLFMSLNAPYWGDEPNYLLISYSILEDGDLELSNNLASFKAIINSSFPHQSTGDFQPHKAPHSPPGKIYSHHDFGVPLLLVPGVYIGKTLGNLRWGALLIIALFTVLFLKNLQLLLNHTGIYSWLVTLAVALSVPITAYAPQVYSELPAVFLITCLLREIFAAENNQETKGLYYFALLCVALIFIHSKNIAMVAMLIVFYITRQNIYTNFNYRKIATQLFLPIVLGYLLWVVVFYIHLGKILPMGAAQGKQNFQFSEILPGLFGWLLDRDRGLLIYSPYFIFAFWGVFLWWRDAKRNFMLFNLAICLAWAFIHAIHTCWWAGICPPCRYMILILPFLALLTAHSLSFVKHPVSLCIFAITVLVSIINSFMIFYKYQTYFTGEQFYYVPYLLWAIGENGLMGQYGIYDTLLGFVFPQKIESGTYLYAIVIFVLLAGVGGLLAILEKSRCKLHR